ncbi:MAG: gamma-glutamylcyclotransferase [Spirochaetales bacterium]|nr:gamma-glutamylcyclotransferase [Spirochaetales bacterium]
MSSGLHRIFVYGTLMRGEYNHRLIESQELEGEGFIRGFNLYNLGHYPGIRPSKHPEHVVYGEVYLVDDRTLERVNQLEGEGSLYLLQFTEVIMKDKTVSAGVYVYNHICKKSTRIYSGCWKQQKIYIAYGSNMNTHQMLEERCPTAKDLGISYLNGYRLLFRANKNGNVYATIEDDASSSVPVVLWAIDKECEDTLDRREGWFRNNPASSYYLKKVISIDFNGESVPGIVYIMTNYGKEGTPSDAYLNRILEGYQEHGIDSANTMNLSSMLLNPK